MKIPKNIELEIYKRDSSQDKKIQSGLRVITGGLE